MFKINAIKENCHQMAKDYINVIILYYFTSILEMHSWQICCYANNVICEKESLILTVSLRMYYFLQHIGEWVIWWCSLVQMIHIYWLVTGWITCRLICLLNFFIKVKYVKIFRCIKSYLVTYNSKAQSFKVLYKKH